jgi:hypothetical protein
MWIDIRMGRTVWPGLLPQKLRRRFHTPQMIVAEEGVPAQIQFRGVNESRRSNDQAKFQADAAWISIRSLSIVSLRFEPIGIRAMWWPASREDFDSP